MKVCACFLLFGIFANTQSFPYIPEENSKRVNLALKTVLEFNDKDKQSDIKLLDAIQNVITEIKTIINKNSNIKNFRRNFRHDTLTDFIQEAVHIINTYDDTAFEDFVHILDDEIRQYHYRGCKFSELMENNEIENFITAKFNSIKGRPTFVKKSKINALSDVVKYENYGRNVKNIVDYINSLYTQAGYKFRRLLSNLEGYGKSKSRRSNTNLVKIIKNGLRSIIFDHYTDLNMNTRRHLKHQIGAFWKRYKNNDLSKRGNIAKVTPYNTKNLRNVIKEAKNLEPVSREYQIKTNNKTTNKKTKLYGIETKHSEHKDKIKKKNDLKNEKKRHNNTIKETIGESFEIQEKETRQTTHNTDFVYQKWNKFKLQEQTGDVDNISVSFSSTEIHKDQQDNTQHFIAIVPDKNSQNSTNVTKKSEIIDTLNVTTKTPTHNITQKNVLWIEQSTGRLPKAVLDKLANKTSRSNPNLTGKNLNKNGPKYQKRWRSKKNKPNKMHRKGFVPENAKTHEKIYDQAGDKTRENINEPENDKTPGGVYKSKNNKMHENIDELENYRADGKIYDRRHKAERPTNHRFEFDSNYELKEDTKYKYMKYLNPNKPTNIKRYETEHRKTQGKVSEPEYDNTHGEIYESNQDLRGNILYDKDDTRSAIKQQFMYASKEDQKHKPYNTKSRKPSIVKHNNRELFSQNDAMATNSLFNKKDEEVQQYKKTKGMLGAELKQDNQPIRYTTERLLQVLDVQMLTEPGKTIKHLARGTPTTKKAPAFLRSPRLNDKARMKATHQTSPLSNSSIGWLHVQLPLNAYSKNDNKRFWKHDRYSRKSTEYSTSFKEGITAENIEIIDDNRHNAETTSFSFLKDSNVNKTIQNLERQLNECISKANVNTEGEIKVERRLEVNSNVVKPKQIKTMSTLDDTIRQDTSKMADAIVNWQSDTDKHSKINDYDVVRGITPETRFRSGINMIPVEFMVQDKLKTAETATIKTEFPIGDHKDKYSENNMENGKKSETGFKSDFEMIPIDNMVRLNVTGAAKNETDFIIEHIVDRDSKNNEYRIEKAEQFKTRSRLNANNNVKVKQNKLKMAGTAVNKIEHIIENKYIKEEEEDSTNNDIEDILNKGIISEVGYMSDLNMFHGDFKDMTDKTEVTGTADNITEFVIEQNKDKDSLIDIENGKKSETNFISDIKMIRNDFNDKTEQTNTRAAAIITDSIENENDFKRKDGVVDIGHQIYRVDDQISVIREASKEKEQIEKDTKQQDIDDVTFETKDRDIKDQDGETLTKDSEIKVIMKDQHFLNNVDDDASKGTETPTTNIASTSFSMKGTESTTKTSATTVVIVASTTPKLIVPVSIPIVTSSKAPDVWKKAEFNATVNENKNKMAHYQMWTL